MTYTEVKIEVDSKNTEAASAIAYEAAPGGIYIEDYSELEQEVLDIAHIDLIDEELLKKDRSKAYIHLYLEPDGVPAEAAALLSERLEENGIKNKIELSDCAEEDWRNNWKKYFNPIEVGEKLLIRPSWRDDYNANGRTVLNIDPGLAFGTGSHETTRLCLEMCEKYLKKGDIVLDIGCGSGVLGIAALLLGAGCAAGVDIDELAVKTALENAEINGVSNSYTAICGSFTDKVSGKYDVIFANIVADAIIYLSAGVKDFMNPDAVYIMSGIIDTRADEVKRAVSRSFDIFEERSDRGWVCFAARLRSDAQ